MKRTVRFPAVFLCVMLLTALFYPVSVRAAGSAIDTAHADAGYFTVSCGAGQQTKMKVGVTHDGETDYYTYEPGGETAYAFTEGDGAYTITLYRNISGTRYKKVETARVEVTLDDPMSPHLVSTGEITFSADDAVGRKAAELCAGLTDDGVKTAAIYRYIAANFTYDHALGDQAARGEVVNYVPDTSRTLHSGAGICYDFAALFAAMCRSEGIPCDIVRGELDGQYHAWNTVYVNGVWSPMDLTRAVANREGGALVFADCVTAMDGYTAAP